MNNNHDLFRINRRIGWIMSLGGAALFLGQAPVTLSTVGDYPIWWNLGVAALAVMVLGLAVCGWALPPKILSICWFLGPILGALLLLTTFISYGGPKPPEHLPWILSFDAALSGYLLLWLRPWAAAAGTIIYASLVPLSALLFLGEIPHVVLVAMPIHMSNIVFIAIFEGIRRRMITVRAAGHEAEMNLTRKMQALANAEHKEQISRMLHDEVVSVLAGAFQTRGIPSERLRAEARRAIALLETPPLTPAPGSEPCSTALDRLAHAAYEVDPLCRMETSHIEGILPVAVTDAIIGAVNEALRNSLRYSGTGSTRTLKAHVESTVTEVSVLDDGIGFDTETTRPESLGINQSIVGRMRGVPGGGASVSSRPGGPTIVELTWRI